MSSFAFQTARSVLSEVGATAKIGDVMAARGCRKVAFVTDDIILKLGLADAALDGLKRAGVDVWTCSDVQPDPPEAMILNAKEQARAEGVDGVVSVGGGSSLDTAKLISVLLNTDQAISDMYGVNLVRGERLPLVLAPTTAGTGSEVTPISIVTTGTNEKKGVVAPQLLPDYAILDAELTVGLPAAVTAATGIDAMVHAIEAFTSKRLKNVVSDRLAKQALDLLGANIRAACHTPDDRQARGGMLLGSMLAGTAGENAAKGAPDANPFDTFRKAMADFAEAVPHAAWMKDDGIMSDTLARLMDPSRMMQGASDPLAATLRNIVDAPELSDIGTLERQGLKGLKEWAALKEAGNACQLVIGNAWTRAFETFSHEMSDQVDVWQKGPRAVTDKWFAILNDELIKTQRTGEFLEAHRKFLRSGVDYRWREAEMVEAWCEARSMPTHSEVDDLHKSLYALRKEVRGLKKELRGARQRTPAAPSAAKAGQNDG
ncbi:iron-containing alcohol dehydrogenase [Defluviimonas sp. WL0002]|uniref:Poly(3-hydroxyalkanoate) polymerase subunit PhaE n=1 Tax=Albidovulum marisflavi TaxID=2984159 RepID=A0ABT2ZGY7_9RHOB|nr:iron-containing alcohol dehydrogenase [Defluviimonas sp. WL0002]MCV2870310.1 iron-containing alcohol dehydrogenase [Defluviimonas sp. WL0002]